MAAKTLIGKVVSGKMQKTVVIETERKFSHPVYKKTLKRTKRIKADMNGFEPIVGQYVKIEQSKPLSHDKHFKVIEIIKGGKKDGAA